jgi:lipooligosaccharide transport system permease protein
MIAAFRIVQRNALVYRRVWRGSLFFNFLQPSLFLVAMGLGLGSLVEQGEAAFPGNVSFLAFLAPGLLASTCMQTATFESSFPIVGKMTWRRNYEAMCATPLRIVDLVLGELLWIGIRLSMVATAFGVVLLVFGIARGPLVIVAVPAAVLTGLGFSALIMAFAGTLKTGADFNVLFRFVITPLFLFSGVFFPISRLPLWLQQVARVTPLYHGVELVRGLVLHSLDVRAAIVHTLYLTVMVLVGALAAFWTFRRRLHA